MKFYITVESVQKLKKSFLNLKLYSVINVPEILSDLGYTYSMIDDYSAFIVNQRIMGLINNYVKSKRIRGVIYSNPNLSGTIISNLFEELEYCEKISDIVILDDYNIPRLKHFYPYFREVIFFPTIKKIRLIEVKPIMKDVEWKV